MTREIKYFMTQFGYLIEVEFNPCGCCPTSAIVTYSKNNFSKGKSYSVVFKNSNAFKSFIRVRKLTELK